ncbi:peptidase T [Odoribacter sp. OttesenSCG-928-J03]|nr:peptidase T [Odoribacter sp. OttesenSCG-928-J03]
MSAVVDRFLRYVKYNTQSDSHTELTPSTPGQIMFATVLEEEMKELGLENVQLDENGYLYGYLPSNMDKEVPAIGFIAHLDTSPDMTGKNVMPRIVEKYSGRAIVLDQEKNIVLSPENSPELSNYVGQDLITTSGNSLLGADDKAGIAEILSAVEYLKKHPEIKHGRICICFTPDEEIGRGTENFNVKAFGAKFAYTLDGSEIGELQYENFNAALAKITFKGRSFHPGYAKNKLINSIMVAHEFIALLPKNDVPEMTSGYDGFFHLNSIKGDVENTEIEVLIRDFDRDGFKRRKGMIENGVREFSRKYGLVVDLELKDQYYNMREEIEPVRYIIDIAKQAMSDVGVKPLIQPIRGGTDGAQLSYMGLPTPNLFTGAHNLHGRYEYIPIPSMEKAVEVVVRIAELCSKL